jgi:hypothetical protein
MNSRSNVVHVLLKKLVLVSEHCLFHVVTDTLDVAQSDLVVAHAKHVVNHAGVAACMHEGGREKRNAWGV